jgi:hypothetical protein
VVEVQLIQPNKGKEVCFPSVHGIGLKLLAL